MSHTKSASKVAWGYSVLGGNLAALGSKRKSIPVSELQDDDLIQRSREHRDSEAFAELVLRHQGKVRGLLLRLTSDRCLADDLSQEVFMRAFRGIVGFEGRARFSTWIYRIAYNVYLNHRSRKKELSQLPEGYEVSDSSRSAPVTAMRSELRNDLQQAIDTLPEHYRAVITLYYLQDVSYGEIAEVLDLPLGTVKTHLHRAKRMLRGRLHGWDAEDMDAVEDVKSGAVWQRAR